MSSGLQSKPRQERLNYISPLRYPGGKAALADFLEQTIRLNGLSDCQYFEPFAGGAGAALRLLSDGVVSEVHLNDFDPCIVAFWNAALDESERFAEKVLTVPVTIEEWRRQSEICSRPRSNDTFDLGFATFFLNRCNRSGVIVGAGPIGGYDQAGIWKIDARFYREQLARRIRALAGLRDGVHVTGMDAKEFLVKQLPRGYRRNKVFVYLDPPYYEKGNRLYLDSYEDRDHRALSRYLLRQSVLKWVASYDDADFIKDLYSSCVVSHNVLQYSLHNKRRAQEILIAPQHVRLPSLAGDLEDEAHLEEGGSS